jgi:hypothetical protein
VNVKSPVMEYTGVVHRVDDQRIWIKLLLVTGSEMLVWVNKETLRGPTMRCNERHRQMDLVVTNL